MIVEQGDVDRAVKRLRRQLDVAGVFVELRRREGYRSPGERRRWKSRQAQRRARRAAELVGE